MPMKHVKLPNFSPKKINSQSHSHSNPIIPTTLPILTQIKTILKNRPKYQPKSNQSIINPSTINWSKIKSHTIPTKWSLYKSLIKHTKSADQHYQTSSRYKDVLVNEIRDRFKQNRSLSSIPEIQNSLRLAYSYLNQLTLSNPSHFIQTKRTQIIEHQTRSSWSKIYKSYYQTILKRPKKPIMTGRFLRPSLFNKPLPRYANQPEHISMMISSRRKSNQRRMDEERELLRIIELDQADRSQAGLPHHPLDRSFYYDRLNEIRQTFVRDRKRERTVYTRSMLNEIEQAKRNRPKDLQIQNYWKRLNLRLDELNSVSLKDINDDDLKEKELEDQNIKFWSG
ncbi:uncharacterized protein MELLADRAFT_72980 [Melampsora larici-populina 98AG31]|uniref:Complex 1 LYR protein domain-containing protein n=1 Tax=Melampsora larici-populina (strain 98AG31 / pathotype 3-4-7) TaxID=747676 RepID=F4S1K8_MELLP|nr:uncharacterized protein MELLADRAFT_72980 [Melampsora larici-populina 98AG31]EGG01488.1 hypothetical protein MELLADRAFT_72980 [Melampsora larici-populina 98AG31]